MKISAYLAFAIILFFGCKTEPAKLEVEKTDLVTNNNLLKEYVNTADPSFAYEVKDTFEGDGWTEYRAIMTSGTWLSENEVVNPEWWHKVTIIKPDNLNQTESLMVIGAGSNKEKEPMAAKAALVESAIATQSVVAEISNIPFQQTTFKNDDYGPRVEDELIAFGWRQFLEGGAKDEDAEWLARFPMTRAVSRGMDVVQEVINKQGAAIDSFVVAGASKRGWTTWTTAIADDRVQAIVPIVIDLLNVLPSFNHHWQVYGAWSPAIQDYIDEGIMDWQGSKEYDRLLELVEPYHFLDQLDMPKFMINATGDEFFVTDSWQFYWDDLQGQKHVQYVPNANHGLNGSYNLGSLIAYYHAVINDQSLPQFDWDIEGNKIKIKVDGGVDYKLTKWEATNPESRDFRKPVIGDAWMPTEIAKQENGIYEVDITDPGTGFKAGMVEVIFNPGSKMPLTFTTGTVVAPNEYPHAPFKSKDPKGSY